VSKAKAAVAVDIQPKKSLLDDAIAKHKIPKWPYEAGFDRIIVFQVPEDKASRESYTPGGLIVKTEAHTAAEEAETPRGIVVSAGLAAQDVMRSHGIGLGHMLWVARHSPWRHEVDRDSDGKVIQFLFLRVGDIVGSENLKAMIAAGDVLVEVQPDGKHVYHFKNEAARPRFDPPSYVA
jgi:hypothetical protein